MGMEDVLARHAVPTWGADGKTGTCFCGEPIPAALPTIHARTRALSAHLAQALTAAGFGSMHDDSTVSRVEVIDNSGRAYVKYTKGDVRVVRQDDGRTLKIFITEGATK